MKTKESKNNGLYIFRLQKDGQEKLLPCIVISDKSAQESLLDAAEDAKNKGIVLDSFLDIPVNILNAHGIALADNMFQDIIELYDTPSGGFFDRFGFMVAGCGNCLNYCEGVCTLHSERKKTNDSCDYLEGDCLVNLIYDKTFIDTYYIDESKIKTGSDLIDAIKLSGNIPEHLQSLLDSGNANISSTIVKYEPLV